MADSGVSISSLTLTTDRKILASLCFHLLMLVSCVGGRQMCLTCQFQSAVENYATSFGHECVNQPLNWTGGEIRMRCPDDCIITATYDAKTSLPTFFFRGCRPVDSSTKNGCRTLSSGTVSCFYSCGDGQNYCNSRINFEGLDNLDDKDGSDGKRQKSGVTNDGDDIVASLYCLMAITAVCATGYFIKKRYCPYNEEEEVEEEYYNNNHIYNDIEEGNPTTATTTTIATITSSSTTATAVS